MRLGIDRLLEDREYIRMLQGRRIALVAHPASMTSSSFLHSMDALTTAGLKLSVALGPQHGIRGDKQDNMVETQDAYDIHHDIPVFSLYGRVRRLTPEMLSHFDVLLVDMQDVGCRIYTFLTTLCYLLEDCSQADKSLWVLDRPNPSGRPVEGLRLLPGFESFVGIGPVPMRHGLTLGEAARWYVDAYHLDLDLKVISMQGYDPTLSPGFGWPVYDMAWVNPSPNMASINAARAYAGTVMLEGTTLSEGRGTTYPLEVIGAPDLDIDAILKRMVGIAPGCLDGIKLRPCFFEPTFHKHAGHLCQGLQMHTDHPHYEHALFKPYRLVAIFLKALRSVQPDYEIWRDFEYEYVTGRLPIDTINGGPGLREWVDHTELGIQEFENLLIQDETSWQDEIRGYLLYPH